MTPAKYRIKSPSVHQKAAGFVSHLFRILPMAVCILAVSFLTTTLFAADSEVEESYVQGELILQLFEDSRISVLQDQYKSVGLRPVKLLSRRMHIWLFAYDHVNMKATESSALLEAVRESDEVALAQFNHYIQQRQTIPNDPFFGNQWGLNNTGQSGGLPDADIDAPEAWDLATGDSTVGGQEIVIAIIDGGCSLTHPDIDFWKNTLEIPNNGIDDDGNGYIDDYDGWNAYNNNGNVPSSTHGTHVAGIAGATGNNATGVSGVNWGAKIMPIAGATGTESIAVAAYGYVFEMRSIFNETDGAAGAFIVSTNSSFGVDFGDPANFPIWCAMYDSMGTVGILSAAATANLNIDIDIQGDVPTACGSDWLISVTNTTRFDTKNSGAAYGATTIDLGAPGTTIYSTVPGGSYSNLTGTSMATPQVTGAVALMYAIGCSNFELDYATDPGGVALFVKQALLDGVDPISDLTGTTVSGGRLNVFNSGLLVLGYPCGLTISHIPLTDTRETVIDYEVLANISSDTDLDPLELYVRYDAGGGWLQESLLPTGNGSEHQAFIPVQVPGTFIDYYIHAGDDNGAVDSTGIFTFKVIDYLVSITPTTGFGSALVDDTVNYAVTITNVGVLNDEYDFSISGNLWSVNVLDQSGTFTVSSTGILAADESFNGIVQVLVPASLYGEVDSVELIATSQGDASQTASASFLTTSNGAPLALPINEEFVDTEVNDQVWKIISGVEVSIDGRAEPSLPYSLAFNGFPSGQDTLMSHVMNLRSLSDVVVRYSYEQTGNAESPDNNDDLFVEYLDSLENWVLLAQYLGADPDMTTYQTVEHPLPGDAYHSNFHLRFRNVATVGDFDYWFVDDIFVGVNAICGDVDGDGEGPIILDIIYLVSYLFEGGPPPPVMYAADVDGDGDLSIIDVVYIVAYLFQNGPPPDCY